MGSTNNKRKSLSSISFFTPCYNEEKNVELTVLKALETLPKVAEIFEIIIVNDGSSDRTEELAKNLADTYKEVRVINHPENRGYGAALKTGLSNSRYDWIFFTDGDLQFDLEQIHEFLPHTKDYNVIVGHRTNRAEGGSRELNAKLFKYFVDMLFGLGVNDIDCAFKLINKKSVENFTLESDGAFISAELLYKLKKLGYEFKQLPVRHYPREHGNPTGANVKVIIKAGKEMLKLFYILRIRNQFTSKN